MEWFWEPCAQNPFPFAQAVHTGQWHYPCKAHEGIILIIKKLQKKDTRMEKIPSKVLSWEGWIGPDPSWGRVVAQPPAHCLLAATGNGGL